MQENQNVAGFENRTSPRVARKLSRGGQAVNLSDPPEIQAMKADTKPALEKRRSHQCQCCASQLGEHISMEGTERVICPSCLGFVARWWIELGQVEQKDLPNKL